MSDSPLSDLSTSASDSSSSGSSTSSSSDSDSAIPVHAKDADRRDGNGARDDAQTFRRRGSPSPRRHRAVSNDRGHRDRHNEHGRYSEMDRRDDRRWRRRRSRSAGREGSRERRPGPHRRGSPADERRRPGVRGRGRDEDRGGCAEQRRGSPRDGREARRPPPRSEPSPGPRQAPDRDGRRRRRSRSRSRSRSWSRERPPRPETRECFKCGRPGHLARDCPDSAGPGAGRGDARECYKCGRSGHIARDCREARRADEGGEWGTAEQRQEEVGMEEGKDDAPPEPNFGLSGKLAEETNTVKGVVVKFQEPPEAKRPSKRWRLYVFKNDKPFGEPLHIHRQSAFMFGRQRKIVDIPTDHPSCSKQHAVLIFRETEKEDSSGILHKSVRPYIMDLGSVNGTYLNQERIEPERYYELLEKDNIKFGNSSRDYVLLHDQSLVEE
uniref:Smad nuclear-interacting protein 1 n=1 Tax=Tetraselmis sp. GSL018 TaxID=582737 RepID=A0A061S969_9CHLO